MKMEIERNNASILAYYGVEDRSAGSVPNSV